MPRKKSKRSGPAGRTTGSKKRHKKETSKYTGPMKPLPKQDTGCNNGQIYMIFDEINE